jgi:hypothetical protein
MTTAYPPFLLDKGEREPTHETAATIYRQACETKRPEPRAGSGATTTSLIEKGQPRISDASLLPQLITWDGAFMEPRVATVGNQSQMRRVRKELRRAVATGCREERMVRVVSMRPPSC